jgi:hypothetical protein
MGLFLFMISPPSKVLTVSGLGSLILMNQRYQNNFSSQFWSGINLIVTFQGDKLNRKKESFWPKSWVVTLYVFFNKIVRDKRKVKR